MSKIYVTMTDKFMSGWGKARGKKNKLVIECNTTKEAEAVARNAKKRSEMVNVNVRHTKPKYDRRRYFPSFKKCKDLGEIWTR